MHNKVLSIRNLTKAFSSDENDSNSKRPPIANYCHPVLSESADSRLSDATSCTLPRHQARSTYAYAESNFGLTPIIETESVCPRTSSTRMLPAHFPSTPGTAGRDQLPIGLFVGKDCSPKESSRDFHGRLKVGMLLANFNNDCDVI